MRPKQGNALLIVLFLMGLLAVLTAVVGQQVMANSSHSAASVSRKEAGYVVQAGLNLALAELNAHRDDASYAQTPVVFSGALPGQRELRYQVTLESNRDGHLGDLPRGAVRVLSKALGPSVVARQSAAEATAFRFQPSYDRALLANRVELAGTTQIKGRLVSVDNITVADSAQVQGDICFRRGVQGSDGTWLVPAGLPAGWIGGTRQSLLQGTHYTGQVYAEATAPLQHGGLPSDLGGLPTHDSLDDFPPEPVFESRPVRAAWQPDGNDGMGYLDSDPRRVTRSASSTLTSMSDVPAFNLVQSDWLMNGIDYAPPDPNNYYRTRYFGMQAIRAQAAQIRGVPESSISDSDVMGPIVNGVAFLPPDFDQNVQVGTQPPMLAPRGYANIHVPAGQTLRMSGRYHIAESFQVDGTVLLDGDTQIYVGQKVVIRGQVNASGRAQSLRVLFTDRQPGDTSSLEMHGGQACMLVAGAGLQARLEGNARLSGSLVADEVTIRDSLIDSSPLADQPVAPTELQSLWTFIQQSKP